MEESLLDRDTDKKSVKSVYFEGDGTDCDTCGWNPDDGEFHLFPDGRFYLRTRYGCYSGNYTEDKAEAIEELGHCLSFMRIKYEVKQIKKLLKRVL